MKKSKIAILSVVMIGLFGIFGYFRNIYLVILISSIIYLTYAIFRLYREVPYDENQDIEPIYSNSELSSKKILEIPNGHLKLPNNCISAVAGIAIASKSKKH